MKRTARTQYFEEMRESTAVYKAHATASAMYILGLCNLQTTCVDRQTHIEI